MKIYLSKLVRFAFVSAVLAATLTSVQPAPGQTWVTNSPLKAARWAHTATLLTNGFVLITGGTIYNVSGNYADTNGCELYNPLTGTSTLADSMQVHRHSHTATLLNNGQVLVIGGGSGTSEIFDPPTGAWISLANMNTARLVHTATLLPSGKVLAAGGYDDSGGGEVSDAELYDPDAATWTSTAEMPYAADTLAAALLTNGMVLVCGGYDGNNSVTNAVLYDPVTETWTNISGMNEARSGHTATVLPNGNVLVVGGNGSSSAEVYDPATETWTYVASMNDGRNYPSALLLNDGQVMVLGDANPDVELYDPVNDMWSYADSLPVPAHLQTATLLPGGQVVVTGGSESDYNGPPLAVVETYSPLPPTPSLAVTADPQSGVPPLNVQFTSPDMDSDGNTVTNWNWDFGDGETSTEQSPSHIYDSVGDYSPSLIAYSIFGSSPLHVTGLGTISVVIPSLDAYADLQSGQAPLTVHFSTPSQDSDSFTVTNWSWDFGDGATSTAQNPSHTYVNPGVFSPSLEARSAYGSAPVSIAYYFSTITVTNPPNPFFHILHSFTANSGPFPSTNSDGTGPNGGLVLLGNTLYGTAQHGGLNGYGTLFALNTNGDNFVNLYNFSLNSNSGAIPPDGVISAGGRFFGTTYLGGNRGGGGTIFAIGTNGLGYTNLFNYNFNVDPTSGSSPQAGLVLAGNTLYGTTWYGGFYNHGTITTVNTNGANSAIFHNFITPDGNNVNPDGIFPSAKMILSGATLYGTALNGGSFGRGVVFAVETNSPGSFRILHHFTLPNQSTGTNSDGSNPFAGLVISGNTLFGTTFAGGKFGYGTVFALTTDDLVFTNLYNFTGANGAYGSHSSLTLSGNTLYGTTSGGGLLGTLSSGTLFSIHTDGSGYTNLYSFTGGSDGATPQGELVLSGNTLYGTAAGGGNSGNGTVFSFRLPGSSSSAIVLINPQHLSSTFQFQFLSQAGFTHMVIYRTNLISGNDWQTYSNVTGDGTLKTIPIPLSVFNPSKQGFVRVSTQ